MSEWGPWIEHDGLSKPVADGVFVHIIFDDEDEFVGVEGTYSTSRDGFLIVPGLGGWIWNLNEVYARVIRYRIRKPRALEQLREIARNPEREMEDA